MTITAIPTNYAGRTFRSRLEARWAMFFSLIGYKWEYEPEGFDIDGVRYLPDFVVRHPLMPHIVRYVEIKPEHVTQNDKFDAFSKQIAQAQIDDGARIAEMSPEGKDYTRAAVLLSGSPRTVLQKCYADWNGGPCPRCGWFDAEVHGGAVVCVLCDYDTPCGGGQSEEIGVLTWCQPHKGMLIIPEEDWSDWKAERRLFLAAADKADAARFGT